ncbi:hypothetical protein PHYPO_G00008680 [Pangasianodon hypophthalmus]|uniref:Ig-like domain-containing protein n=1 Tax=Pangasianodon hypophthalmus TaxID=310915 RepID=A0A5N5Q6P2_PANHP|nr:hypothetical protein PHYPO_G00008680 [Pangasianodon hypophthalmus]
MDFHAVCCTLLLLTCTGVCFGQELLLPERINKAVGENVVITPILIPDPPHFLITWKFNERNILSGPPSGIIILPAYRDRVSLDTTTLALELRSLTESDTGTYSLSVETGTGLFHKCGTSLQVFVPASDVTIVPSKTELVEFNSTVSLVCSASGSTLSFIWLNGSSEVTAGERVQLTDSNSSLTITSVIRGDTGPYQCEASNIVSKAMSLPLNLTIYYGPENVTVEAAPVGPIYSSGSTLTLTCSAESSPAAEFQWAVNGAELGEMGQELRLSNIQSSQSGNYTCIAHNKQTLRYSMSEPIDVTVLVGPDNVIINGPSEVEVGKTVMLSCHTESTPTAWYKWMFNGTLTEVNTTVFTVEQANVTHTGNYTCTASNPVTGRKASGSHVLVVKEKGTAGGGGNSLSAGAIAGIVIGVLLAIAGVAGLVFYFVKGKKIPETTSRGNKKNGATRNEGQHELHYADVSHLQSNQRQQGIPAVSMAHANSYVSQYNKTATSNPATQTIYSDVRNL